MLFCDSAAQLRRLSDSEQKQTPLREKNKQYLTRNVRLTAKNKELEEALRKMKHQLQQEPATPTATATPHTGPKQPLKRSSSKPDLVRLPNPQPPQVGPFIIWFHSATPPPSFQKKKQKKKRKNRKRQENCRWRQRTSFNVRPNNNDNSNNNKKNGPLSIRYDCRRRRRRCFGFPK